VFFDALVSVTVAPGITPPWTSATVPVTPPVTCAEAEAAIVTSCRSTIATLRYVRFIIDPPCEEPPKSR
jgi:hypothetical protein